MKLTLEEAQKNIIGEWDINSPIQGSMQRFAYDSKGMEFYRGTDRTELERDNLRQSVPYSIEEQAGVVYLRSKKPLIEICSITEKYMFWRLQKDGEADKFYVLIRRA